MLHTLGGVRTFKGRWLETTPLVINMDAHMVIFCPQFYPNLLDGGMAIGVGERFLDDAVEGYLHGEGDIIRERCQREMDGLPRPFLVLEDQTPHDGIKRAALKFGRAKRSQEEFNLME